MLRPRRAAHRLSGFVISPVLSGEGEELRTLLLLPFAIDQLSFFFFCDGSGGISFEFLFPNTNNVRTRDLDLVFISSFLSCRRWCAALRAGPVLL